MSETTADTQVTPTSNGGNGDKDPVTGKFVKGNRAAVGRRHPLAARVQELKGVVQDALTDNRVEAVIIAMLKRAMGGDVAAARLLLEYGIGPASKLELNIGIDASPRKRIIIEPLPADDSRRQLSAFRGDTDIIDGEAVHRSHGPMLTDDSEAVSTDTQKTCEQADSDQPDDCADSCASASVTEPHSTPEGCIEQHPDMAPETQPKASEGEGGRFDIDDDDDDDDPWPDPYALNPWRP